MEEARVGMRRGKRTLPKDCYVLRLPNNYTVAFVPDPDQVGRWLKVSTCVVFCECPVCDAPAGQPCRSVLGTRPSGLARQSHHVDRANKFDARGLARTPAMKIDMNVLAALQAAIPEEADE